MWSAGDCSRLLAPSLLRSSRGVSTCLQHARASPGGKQRRQAAALHTSVGKGTVTSCRGALAQERIEFALGSDCGDVAVTGVNDEFVGKREELFVNGRKNLRE